MTRHTINDALRWRDMYELENMTIEQIALEIGTSIGTIRRWLLKVAYNPRPAGAGHRQPAADRTTRPTGIHYAARNPHRRRGGF
jgi:hypothetical protein